MTTASPTSAPWWRLLSNLRMAKRLGLVLALILALLIGVALAGYWGASVIRSQAADFVDGKLGSLQQMARLRESLARSRAFEKDVILSIGDTASVTKARAAWAGEQQRLDEALQALHDSLGEAGAPAVVGIRDKVKAYRVRFGAITSQVEMGVLDNAMAANRLMRAVNADFEAVNAALAGIADSVNAQADQAKARLDEHYRRVLQMIAGVTLAALVLAVVLGLAVTQSVVVPLRHGVEAASGIAAGRLHERIDADGRDETAELLSALRAMQDSLKSTVAGVQSSIGEIATASGEIAAGNHDLSHRTEVQASSLKETSASLAGLTDTVHHNARSAAEAKRLAQHATQVAEEGGQVVGQVVDTMAGIKQSSDRIADIIGVINDIAFQTNILALNAAVEASRAGDQGRGFAVVAGEVRVLAQRSASAAKEIAALIQGSVDQVGAGGQRVHVAGETMGKVVEATRRVATLVSDIASASSTQSAAIDQLNKTITGLDRMTQQNSALVEQSAAAAESLRDQTVRLTEAIAVFKT